MRKKSLRLFWMALFVGFVDFLLLTILVYFPQLFHFSIYLRILKNLNIWAYCHFALKLYWKSFRVASFIVV